MFITDSVHIATLVQRKNKSMGETTHSHWGSRPENKDLSITTLLPAGILPSVRNRSLNPSPSSLSIGESRPRS